MRKHFEEFSKEASIGVVADIIAASFLSSIVAAGLQHGKGIGSALKSGASLRSALKADPLPLGKSWRYSKLKKPTDKLKIDMKNVHMPFNSKSPYEYRITSQRELARTIGVPVGAALAIESRRKGMR